MLTGRGAWKLDGRCNGPQQRFGELSLLVLIVDFFNLFRILDLLLETVK